MTSSRPAPFHITVIIVAALAGGVFLLWGAAWFLTGWGEMGMSPDMLPHSLALVIWAAVALPAFGGALYFRSRAAGAGGRASQVQTFTVIAHALLEGPALLGGIFLLLLGTGPVVWAAPPVYVLGLWLTWPRRAWFADAREQLPR